MTLLDVPQQAFRDQLSRAVPRQAAAEVADDRLGPAERVAIVQKWDSYGKHLARRWWMRYPRWGTLDEFRMAAQEGLWEAAVRFEPGRGLQFSTFATFYVRKVMQQLIQATKGILISQSQNERYSEIVTYSLDAPRFDDIGNRVAFADTIPGREEEPRPEIPADFWDRVNKWLDHRERRIIQLRFRDNRTLHDISLELGVSRERVRQLEGKALRKLERRAGLSECLA